MTLIVCLDDNLGMMFNHRRQSRDRVLIAELLNSVGDGRLLVSPYSAPLFPPDASNIHVAKDPCAEASESDFVWIEDTDFEPAWNRCTSVWFYRWNRTYPADRYFRGNMTDFRLTESTSFVGSSHDQITKEVWKK